MAIEKPKTTQTKSRFLGGNTNSKTNNYSAYTYQEDGNPNWNVKSKWDLIKKSTPSSVRWQVGTEGGPAPILDGKQPSSGGRLIVVTAEVLDMTGRRMGRRIKGELSIHNTNAAGDYWMGIVEDQTATIIDKVEEIDIIAGQQAPAGPEDESHVISWSVNPAGNTNGYVVSQWESGQDGYFWFKLRTHSSTGTDHFLLHLTVGHKIFISPILSWA